MSRKLTNQEFVSRAEEVHKNKYDYTFSNYKNYNTKVKILCQEHGIFEQAPINHLRGRGCKQCVYDNLKSNTSDFIRDSKKVHGNIYSYSATTYSGCYSKVIITCLKHGNFKQKPYSHKQGKGCPICNNSKGEKEVRLILEKCDIKYIPQKTFDDCKNVFLLSFDFYLPDYNLCIEYDGEQHFRPMGFSGGEKSYKRIVKNDNIKNEYCKVNNIELLRIKFNENVIDKLKQTIELNV
ncbi:MAG: hypothetical protein ACTSX1_04860 [Candidatus Heimdallarchaeaceae archaeon]